VLTAHLARSARCAFDVRPLRPQDPPATSRETRGPAERGGQTTARSWSTSLTADRSADKDTTDKAQHIISHVGPLAVYFPRPEQVTA
jgi:hypothetical protein